MTIIKIRSAAGPLQVGQRESGRAQNKTLKSVLSHMVVNSFIQLWILALKLDFDVKVHITTITSVGLDTEGTLDFLPCVHCEIIPDVEHRLFPVGVRSFWWSCEADALVGFAEVDTEVGDKGVDVVVSPTTKGEVDGEG